MDNKQYKLTDDSVPIGTIVETSLGKVRVEDSRESFDITPASCTLCTFGKSWGCLQPNAKCIYSDNTDRIPRYYTEVKEEC